MLTLIEENTGKELILRDYSTVIAGYTARDKKVVQQHIHELAEIGVPAPPRTPMFYVLNEDLVTTEPEVRVATAKTSGEVEPVYIRQAGKHYLAIGSDHTDRKLEVQSILESKRVCPKPIGRKVLSIDSIDEFSLAPYRATCYADGVLYQQDSLDSLLDPRQVLTQMEEELDLGEGDYVCFGGTLALLSGEFVYAKHWKLTIEAESSSEPLLTHEYTVTVSS